MNNAMNMIQQFMQFKNSFKGNPQEQVQQMLNSGRITQDQYNNAVKQAQQFQNMLNGMKQGIFCEKLAKFPTKKTYKGRRAGFYIHIVTN